MCFSSGAARPFSLANTANPWLFEVTRGPSEAVWNPTLSKRNLFARCNPLESSAGFENVWSPCKRYVLKICAIHRLLEIKAVLAFKESPKN